MNSLRRETNEFIVNNIDNPKVAHIQKRKKRKRKLKEQIQREYQCLVDTCSRSYGFGNKYRELLELAS